MRKQTKIAGVASVPTLAEPTARVEPRRLAAQHRAERGEVDRSVGTGNRRLLELQIHSGMRILTKLDRARSR